MPPSTPTKPYVIEGPKGREFKTLGGLLRACARASGNQYSRVANDHLIVEWPEVGEAKYTIVELDDSFLIESQLGYDLT